MLILMDDIMLTIKINKKFYYCKKFIKKEGCFTC